MAPSTKTASSLVTLDAHAFRQVLLDVGDGRVDAVGDVERVRLRLADDADADAGLAVGAQRGLADIGAERHRRDVAEPGVVRR